MKPAPRLSDEVDDIQAVLGSGFGWLHRAEFRLLQIEDRARFRRWLLTLLEAGEIHSVGELTERRARNQPKVAKTSMIAFTDAGLQRLGIVGTRDFPFATPFRCGMGSALRRRLLRDATRETWRWSDVGCDVGCDAGGDAGGSGGIAVVHLLYAVWSRDDAEPMPTESGCRVIREVSSPADSFASQPEDGRDAGLREPFGFRDGISQPLIFGLRGDLDPAAANRLTLRPGTSSSETVDGRRDQVVAPGEFVMGYVNEYDERSYCADVEGWGGPGRRGRAGRRFALNGSYLAVREIEQHVAAFETLDRGAPGAAGCPSGSTIVEKIVGRRRDGVPLAREDALDANTRSNLQAIAGARGRTAATVPDDDDAFRYRVADANGFLTPRGAHIRRAHPRDTLAHDVASGIQSSKLHRLLRRGRPYRSSTDGKEEVGTFFIACNADLERQFEFVLQRWIHNPRFADLDDEDDPLIGHHRRNDGRRVFTQMGLPTGCSVEIPQLTTTRGGGYFFLPGLEALRFVASEWPADGLETDPSKGCSSLDPGKP